MSSLLFAGSAVVSASVESGPLGIITNFLSGVFNIVENANFFNSSGVPRFQ
jgi:hypothetical protein